MGIIIIGFESFDNEMNCVFVSVSVIDFLNIFLFENILK
jgi:hypothetical protein